MYEMREGEEESPPLVKRKWTHKSGEIAGEAGLSFPGGNPENCSEVSKGRDQENTGGTSGEGMTSMASGESILRPSITFSPR